MNFDELFLTAERMIKKAGKEELRGLSGIYELRLTGESGCCIHAEVSGGRISLGRGARQDAVCSAETDGETLEALLAGRISPAAAIMSGRVRLRGSVRELGRLAALLRRLS